MAAVVGRRRTLPYERVDNVENDSDCGVAVVVALDLLGAFVIKLSIDSSTVGDVVDPTIEPISSSNAPAVDAVAAGRRLTLWYLRAVKSSS